MRKNDHRLEYNLKRSNIKSKIFKLWLDPDDIHTWEDNGWIVTQTSGQLNMF